MNHRWEAEQKRRREAMRRGITELEDRNRRDHAMSRNASPWEIGAAHWNQRDLYTRNPRIDEEGYGHGPSLHPDEGSFAYRRHLLHEEPPAMPRDEYYEKEAWPWFHYREPPWRGKHTGKGPKGWAPSPARIRDEICDSLACHGDLDATDVEVTVHGTEVTLEGTVTDQRQKRLAEDLAMHCTNVTDVHNRLKVRPHDDPTDADVAFVTPLRAL
jgi:hypothetical protein